MTQFRFASDIHLERYLITSVKRKITPLDEIAWHNLIQDILPDDDRDEDSVLVLAGDILSAEIIHLTQPFWKNVTRRFRAVVYIPGNHEYYYRDIETTWDSIVRATLKRFDIDHDKLIMPSGKNVTGEYDIDDFRILMTPLWTSFGRGNPMSMLAAQRMIKDYERIYIGNGTACVRPNHIYDIHMRQAAWLWNAVDRANEEGRKVMVVTHHTPSMACSLPHYKGSAANASFHNGFDLLELFDHHVDYWVHGHVHDHLRLTLEQGTEVIANPYGYIHQVDNGYVRNHILNLG